MKDKLPAYYREDPGHLLDIVELVEARDRELRGELASRQAAFEGEVLAREVEPGGTASRNGLSGLLEAESCFSSSGRFGCHASFREWLGRRVASSPHLWPGLALEDIGGSSLRVRLSEGSRTLAVVWSAETGMQLSRIPSLDLNVARDLPLGLHVQFAVIDSPLPRNPHVEGLILEGVVSELWV